MLRVSIKTTESKKIITDKAVKNLVASLNGFTYILKITTVKENAAVKKAKARNMFILSILSNVSL